MALLIVASVVITVVGTEPTVVERYPALFASLELFFAAVFVGEYLMRLWVVGATPRFRGVDGRLRYMVTPLALIDLVTFVAFALGVFGA